MAKLFIFLIQSLTASSGFAQSINTYMKLRQKYEIYRAINVSGLDNFVGTRYVELKGTVKGSFKAKGVTTVLLEDYEGQTVEVDCPDGGEEWMLGGEVSTRMIVKATRPSAGDGVRKTMIAAAPESDVARREEGQIRAAQTAQPSRHGNRTKLNPLTTKYAYVVPPAQVIPVYANFIRKWNKRVSQNQSMHIANAVIGYSLKYGVDARLIMAILMAESDFNIGEHSHAGAMGLGQLMPVNAQELGINNAYDIYQNLYGTVVLVRGHLEKYQRQTSDDVQSLALALAGYNAGDGAVRKYGGIPPYRETQNYVRKVINYYRWLRGA